jgi:hypothetical protein
LYAAIDTEHGPGTPRRGVVTLAARLGPSARVHDATAFWAVADRRVDAPVIHVVARIEPHRSSHRAVARDGVDRLFSCAANQIPATRAAIHRGSSGPSRRASRAQCFRLAPPLANLGPESSSRFELTAVALSAGSLRGAAIAKSAQHGAGSSQLPAQAGEDRTHMAPQRSDEPGGLL